MAAPVVAKVVVQVANSKTGRRIIAGVLVMALAIVAVPVFVIGALVMQVTTAASAQASCTPVEGQQGDVAGFSPAQLQHAQTIITVGRELEVPEKGIKIALMVALVETELKNLTNPTVPGAPSSPDGSGQDHDSLGLFQQRGPWGSPADRMNPKKSTQAFFGGPKGPNHVSPPGLLDIDGWEKLSPGVAAQRVQVSAFPDRYAKREADAQRIMDGTGVGCTDTGGGATGQVVGKLAYPIAKGTNAGTYPGHHGVDFPMPTGTPIFAVGDGKITFAGRESWGARVIFLRLDGPGGILVQYGHMCETAGCVTVKAGDKVKAGQKIGAVGNSGNSHGSHLHLEVEQGVPAGVDQKYNSTTAPYRWLKKHGIAPGKIYKDCGNCQGMAELVDDFAYSGVYTR